MSNETTDGTRAHIDAETLAAWADESLSAEVASAVELHLADCERCQEVLAAFVRSEPAPVAVVVPFWSRRPVKWSTAGLAAAAAVVTIIWVAQPPAPVQESTVARAPIDSVGVPTAAPPAAPPVATEPAESKARVDKPRQTPAARAEADKQAKAERAAPAAQSVAVSAPPPPASERRVVTAPPVTVSAGAPAAAMRDASAVLEIVAPDPAANLASRSSADPTGGAGRGGGAARDNAFRATGPTRWRVVAGLRIERSSDGGRSWSAMALKPALTTPVVAGAATSQFVCWFVGANGVVLVTTDGSTLRRVSIPESILLVSVIPEDGSRAVVVAADGRKFSTLDGGLTWR